MLKIKKRSNVILLAVIIVLLATLSVVLLQRLNTSKPKLLKTREEIESRGPLVRPKVERDSSNEVTPIDRAFVYTQTAPKLSVTCNDSATFPADNLFVDRILGSIKLHDSFAETICYPRGQDKYLVVERLKTDSDIESRKRVYLSLYQFSKDGEMWSEVVETPFLLATTEKSFKLESWYGNDDLIYTIMESRILRAWTFVKAGKTVWLLEYCGWGIQKGNSARVFHSCTSFSKSNQSKYLKASDLP
jgi:hypothetical protein